MYQIVGADAPFIATTDKIATFSLSFCVNF